MKLYEISNEYNQFLQAVEDEEIPIEAVADTLEGIKGEFNEKADNIACMIKNQEAEMLAIKAEKEALDKRMKSKKAQIDSLKHYLSCSMQAIGMERLETPRNAISFRKSTSLYIADEEAFKEQYPDLCITETTVKIPKADVTKLMKEGKELEGAELSDSFVVTDGNIITAKGMGSAVKFGIAIGAAFVGEAKMKKIEESLQCS